MPAIKTQFSGNLTADPELRYTPSGVAVATLSVAVNERYRDTQTQEWKDGPTSFVRCFAWRDLGEHIAESFQRGDRVMVTGTLRARSWETKEGEKRTSWEVTIDDLGASVRYATVKVSKTSRTPLPDEPYGRSEAEAAAPVSDGDEPPF